MARKSADEPEAPPRDNSGENPPDRTDEIAAEIHRVSALVPGVGESWRRWYDYPYRMLKAMLLERRWWKRTPRRVREAVMRFVNILYRFNEYDREKVGDPGDPLRNMFAPSDERVELPALWVVELYGPAHANILTRSLARESWARHPFGELPGSEMRAQVRRMRERDYGFHGRVASFVDVDLTGWWHPGAKRERLPEGFDHVEVFVEALGPSLTALVAEFYLDDSARLSIDRLLHAEHGPKFKLANGHLHLYQRLFQGINAVQGERERLHRSARRWLADRVPGLFAAEEEQRLPVMDLLLTRLYDPLAKKRLPDRGSYQRALGLGMAEWTRITLPELPGLVLSHYRPERLRQDDASQWALVAKYEDALSDEDFRGRGDETRTPRNIAAVVSEPARSLLTRLAIGELLQLQTREMNRSRDIANQIHAGVRPVRSIKRLRDSLLTRSIDLAAISEVLKRMASKPGRYDWGVPRLRLEPGVWQLEATDREPDPADDDLLATWRNDQLESIEGLVQADRELNSVLGIVSSLTSALSGIRSQRVGIALSLASLAAAAAATWLAYLAIAGGN